MGETVERLLFQNSTVKEHQDSSYNFCQGHQRPLIHALAVKRLLIQYLHCQKDCCFTFEFKKLYKDEKGIEIGSGGVQGEQEEHC